MSETMQVRMAVKIDGEIVPVPPEFWRAVGISSIYATPRRFNRRQCALLWKMLGRSDTPPKSTVMYIRGEDFDTQYPGRWGRWFDT
jgi:hypothetical protein